MPKKEKLDDKKLADMLTAQMGLATQEEETVEKGEGCLSSEQLADVAANLCTPEEREKAIEHFSGCQACYDEWVSLCFSLAAMESGSSSGKMPLVTIRNLGYLGSALAIAACVVLFINLKQDMVLQEDGIYRPPAEKNAVRQVPQPKRELVGGGRAEPEGKVSREKLPAPVLESRRVQERQAADESAVTADLESAPPMTSGFTRAEGGDEVSSWISRVEEACLVGRGEAAFWSEIRTEGQDLLAELDDRGQEHPQYGLLTRLLVWLPASPEKAEAQCARIITLLDNMGEKR